MDQPAIEAYLKQIREAKDAVMRPCPLVTAEMRPIPAQRVGIAHLFLRPRLVLADPTGSGKTPMTLAALGYLRHKDPSLRALVVTTKGAQFQWKASVERFLKGAVPEVLGYTEQRRKVPPAARHARYHNGARESNVWITTLATLAQDEAHLLPNLDNFVVAFDEIHRLGNRKQAVLYPAAQRVAQKARCTWGLSATPLRNDRLDELYSIMELVRPGTFGSYSQFRRTYYILRLVTPKWTVKSGPNAGQKARSFYEVLGHTNLDHLRATIDPYYLRRPFEEFGADLPGITFRREDVELEPAQRKLYNEVWKWPGKDGNRILKIVAIQKSQAALGAPETIGRPDVPNAKLEALQGLLTGELLDSKVVVYSKSAETVGVIHRALTAAGIAHGQVTGEVEAGAREAARLRFQTAPDYNVMLVTDAGGEALDLQAAGVLVFYDLPWSHGNFMQVLGRARRFGSKHPNVLAILLVASRSYDEPILAQLLRKENTIRDLIRQGNSDSDVTLNSTFNSDSDTLDTDICHLFDSIMEEPTGSSISSL